MDIITVSYYALVCGALGLAGPRLGRPLIRLGIGGIVGILAATLLPTVRLGLGL
ncbi:MAG: hypothetical protein RID15_12840 [Marinovum algicola]|jgi:hypothetical protein|uniref:Uncharacterized protein n=1 Tax=Marinovum algicola TaxID=42444 RepID=A0A975WC32_9RHOB|nr:MULTISPECIES: hypothetical protein [Marinovum]AKO95320.1 hypothetical protein MALG_00103 [Marinovum algicola DG 898]MDD9738415.1 hypothetical protein [Marinovum sp. SP66]MDD9745544.1 hypothetical protein [Marinovum sp. PR37]SEJ85970.1 hypothetical protein SAMN04487940_11221 [Marinovum algicola]SLN67724.1 hypothetical protein MAA5396_03660 [Marinovum algicola]